MINFLALLTVTGQLIALFMLVVLLRQAFLKKPTPKVSALVERYGLLFMFIVATIATGGSLYLSEILKWAPCKLCWLQRIFAYPQVPILLVALWKRDKKIAPYILTLCILGILFSITHYTEQVSVTLFPAVVDPTQPCDATGVSCATTYTFRFGYITIPMMAFTAFLMNLLTSSLLLKSRATSRTKE